MTIARSLSERFWPNVKKGSAADCWEWQAKTTSLGYGTIRATAGKDLRAHRVAWMLTFGDPGDLWVLHRCDNPPCVNPGHLFLGTATDNVQDMHAKGRGARGERNGRAKLTPDQVLEIRRVSPNTTHAGLAAKYRVSEFAIRAIVRRLTWKHLWPAGGQS